MANLKLKNSGANNFTNPLQIVHIPKPFTPVFEGIQISAEIAKDIIGAAYI